MVNGIENETIRLKNLNWNCSCEKVLCAMGDLISVVLCTLVGLNAKEGLPVLEWFFWIYHNHVINKYDCFAKIFLVFFDLKGFTGLFSKRIFVILCGVIKDTKEKLYFILGNLLCFA